MPSWLIWLTAGKSSLPSFNTSQGKTTKPKHPIQQVAHAIPMFLVTQLCVEDRITQQKRSCLMDLSKNLHIQSQYIKSMIICLKS